MKGDNRMNAKKYLQQAFFLNERIADKLDELKDLRSKAASVGAVDPAREKVQNNKIIDSVGDSVIAIVDLETDILCKIDECGKKKREIENTVEMISDVKVKAVLLKRYVHFYEWEDIMEKLGYAEAQVFRLHKIGLREIEKMIVNDSK